jgi:hypothetical protein
VGDFDNDGDPDVVFSCVNDRPVLLRNHLGHERGWVGFELVGSKSNRDAIGAKLTLRYADRTLTRWISGGSSYLASHDRRVLFGLDARPPRGALTLEIRWPNGALQRLSGLETRRYHKVLEFGDLRAEPALDCGSAAAAFSRWRCSACRRRAPSKGGSSATAVQGASPPGSRELASKGAPRCCATVLEPFPSAASSPARTFVSGLRRAGPSSADTTS